MRLQNPVVIQSDLAENPVLSRKAEKGLFSETGFSWDRKVFPECAGLVTTPPFLLPFPVSCIPWARALLGIFCLRPGGVERRSGLHGLPGAGHLGEGPICLMSSHSRIQRGGLGAQAAVRGWGLLAFPPRGCLGALTWGGARLSASAVCCCSANRRHGTARGTQSMCISPSSVCLSP